MFAGKGLWKGPSRHWARGTCLTVRAVSMEGPPCAHPAGTGVTGVMDPGLGSVRPIGRVKGSESTVRIPRGIEAVRLPDRL